MPAALREEGRQTLHSNQQCACAELQHLFQKPVQKCMNSYVHVSFFFSEASANLFFSKHLWLKRFSCRMFRQEELISKVSKMMRAHCPPGGPASSTFLQADPEHIIEKLESLVKELVMLKEVRKTAKFLGQCAQMAFPRMPSAEHKVLGERLLAACEHIAVKRKSATTGKKLPQQSTELSWHWMWLQCLYLWHLYLWHRPLLNPLPQLRNPVPQLRNPVLQ